MITACQRKMRVLLSMLNAGSLVKPDISNRHCGVKGLSPINSHLNSHINSCLSSRIIRHANLHEVNVDLDDLSDMTHGMCWGSVTADEQEIYETDSAEISYKDPYVKNCPDTVPVWRVKLDIARESMDFKIDS